MNKYFYLVKIQFIGFRFCGWQMQSNGKTIQLMIEKTISYILKHQNFKVLGAGRTDAKVSANEYAFELFLPESIVPANFLESLNKYLPPDIRALEVTEVSDQFNIMGDAKIKEYLYLFTHGEKPHPFSAPFMVHFQDNLDVELMKGAAKIFEGTHDFTEYCHKPSEHTILRRCIDRSEIVENDIYTANFFPANSWVYRVEGKGFLRHQIRLMMGALVRVGAGEWSLQDIENSLNGSSLGERDYIAPSSGLMLKKISF